MLTKLRSLLAAAILILPGAAGAQSFPNREVTLVVPFAPGGTVDVMGRFVAEKLSAEWRQPVVVENRPGAGSMIGAASVSQARPDGHTLLIVSGSFTTGAAIQKGLPFDPAADLKPVGLVGMGHYLLIAGSRHQIGSMEELVSLDREQKIFYGTTGVGSISHLSGQLLNDILGTQMEAVHYEGGSPAMVDLGGGRLDLFIGSPSEAATGLGRPIATLSSTRLATLPDVPTVAEAGFPDAQVAAWWGILAPANTPDEIVDKVSVDISRVMSTPESAEFLAAVGAEPPQMDAQQFTDHVTGELDRWTTLSEKHGIQSN
jgi:tripartite-type tricarboxylate transporter receptor subunit TctC